MKTIGHRGSSAYASSIDPAANPNGWLADVYTQVINADRRRRAADMRWFDQAAEATRAAREEALTHVRPGDCTSYALWLRGFVAGGGSPTHFYDYQTPEVWVVESSFVLPALCGAHSLGIVIVPKGIEVDTSHRGHTNVFFMDGFRSAATTVSVYSDSFLA